MHLLSKPMDKDFPLKSSCGLLLIRNIDSKIYVTTINVSTKSSVTQSIFLFSRWEVSLSDVEFNIFFYAGDPTLRLFGSLTICLLSSLAALLCMALGNYSFYCISNYIINEKFKELLSDMK